LREGVQVVDGRDQSAGAGWERRWAAPLTIRPVDQLEASRRIGPVVKLKPVLSPAGMAKPVSGTETEEPLVLRTRTAGDLKRGDQHAPDVGQVL
jgi:hypothetical protein